MKKIILTMLLILFPMIVFAQKVHRGVVLQTFNVEGYTYMEIKDNNETKWIACPTLDVKKGDVVETSYGMLMPDFESKTLKRTFKEIYFVTKASVVSSGKEQPKSKSEKPKGDGKAYSISEIVEKKDTLAGKIVIFEAKVVKYTPSIMGVNWLHVTEPVSSNNKIDLVVTTNDVTKVGSIIKIEGVLTVNKNLGSGYFFPIIVENAKISTLKD